MEQSRAFRGTAWSMMPIPFHRMGYGGGFEGRITAVGDDLSSFIDRNAEDDLRFGDWGLRIGNRCQSHPHRYICSIGRKRLAAFYKTVCSEIIAYP